MEPKLRHKTDMGACGRARNYFKYALLAGAIAGCAGGYRAVQYEIARLPDNGDNCPALGDAFQVFQGQETGFGFGSRPLYLLRVTAMDGSDVTMEARMPLAAPTPADSQVSWTVTFAGLSTNVEGMARTADSTCRLVSRSRPSRPAQADAGVEAGVEQGAPAQDGSAGGSGSTNALLERMTASTQSDSGAGVDPGVLLLEGGAGGASGAGQRDAGPPAPVELPRPPELVGGVTFPPDSSAEFARRIQAGLGGALSSLATLMGGGNAPSGSFTIERSDANVFTLRSGERTVVLKRRIELQWDVAAPQAATLRVPYTITNMSMQGGSLNVTVSLDCSRDMEAIGSGLGVRSGPHPSCRSQ